MLLLLGFHFILVANANTSPDLDSSTHSSQRRRNLAGDGPRESANKIDSEVAQRTLEETSCGGAKTVVVNSINHKEEGTTGKYFYFNKQDWIAMDGYFDVLITSVKIDQWRDGSKINSNKAVTVWDNNNGIHGRFVSNPNSGDWQVGDVISLKNDNCASVAVPYTFDGCSTNPAGDQVTFDFGITDPDNAIAFVQCCSMNGASCTRKSCSYSGDASNGGGTKKTWWEAKQICEADGKRLCANQAEVDKCCSGSGAGCQYNNNAVWATIPSNQARNLARNPEAQNPRNLESQEIAGKADNDNTQVIENVVF